MTRSRAKALAADPEPDGQGAEKGCQAAVAGSTAAATATSTRGSKRRLLPGNQQDGPEASSFAVSIPLGEGSGRKVRQRKLVSSPGASPPSSIGNRRSSPAARPPAPPPPVTDGGAEDGMSSWDVLRFLRARLGGSSASSREHGADMQMDLRPQLLKIRDEVEGMVSDVVESGNSTSILLIGDRGSGKTEVVEQAISLVQAKFSCGGGGDGRKRVGIVRLNGLTVNDDRLAFKETASQLCSLAEGTFSKSASYDENLGFLKEALELLGEEQKTVVFVLDELDAFARRTKQVVLYNLFDALQSASVSACVVGTSCRHDCVELLEKRVQSRFSHRKFLITQPQITDSEDTEEPQPHELLEEMLSLPESMEARSATAKAFADSVERSTQDPRVKDSLAEVASISPQWVADVALLALSKMDPGTCRLEPKHICDSINAKLAMETGQAELLSQLSVLQLFLLVGLCRLSWREDIRYNFQALFHEYLKLYRSNSDTCESVARANALRAFEELIGSGMVTLESEHGSAAGMPLEYRPVRLLLSVAEVKAGIKAHPYSPSILYEWLTKESVVRFSGLEI